MIAGLVVSSLVGGAIVFGRLRPVEVPVLAEWPGQVTVCASGPVDRGALEEAVGLWREHRHDVVVGVQGCEIDVVVDPTLDQRASVTAHGVVRGRTELEHRHGELTRAVVRVAPDIGVLGLCHELGHALGYLHPRAAPTGHLLHPHHPSLDDWRGLRGADEG